MHPIKVQEYSPFTPTLSGLTESVAIFSVWSCDMATSSLAESDRYGAIDTIPESGRNTGVRADAYFPTTHDEVQLKINKIS